MKSETLFNPATQVGIEEAKSPAPKDALLLSKEQCGAFQYAFGFEYDHKIVHFCQYLRERVGRNEFNYREKKWRFKNISLVDAIRSRFPMVDIDPSLDDDLKKYIVDKEEKSKTQEIVVDAKENLTADIEIPGLLGNLYDYQKVGINFLVKSNGRAILADTMGLGKSVQAIGYTLYSQFKHTLIICPASVKYVWKKEFLKWTSVDAYVVNGSVKGLSPEKVKEIFEKTPVIIINYDIVKTYFNILKSIKWDVMICDEYHYLKNSSAQRTKYVKSLSFNIPHLLFLSGTPILNRPIELFNGLQMLEPSQWSNWRRYALRYCQAYKTPWGLNTNGASNIDELKGKIQHLFIRRTKEEVLKELPPKQFTDVPVELNEEDRFSYNLTLSSFSTYLKEVKNKTDKEITKSLQAEKLTKLNELRQITSKGKLKAALDLIENIVESGEKVVVFSVYNDTLKWLSERLGDKAVTLTGNTIGRMREEVVDRFQNDPSVMVFLGGTKSAGVGITLTAASNVIFLDYSWVPADHAQAADRTHRIGQKAESINIYQLYSRNTIDEYMCNLLSKKSEVFNQLIGPDGHQVIGETIDVIGNLLTNIESQDGT